MILLWKHFDDVFLKVGRLANKEKLFSTLAKHALIGPRTKFQRPAPHLPANR